jgi:thiol-disulfide isomerase/thioredoxin
MSQQLSRPWCLPILAALGLVGGIAVLAGCNAEAGPVTAASSEFRPAGDGEEAAPATSDAGDPGAPASDVQRLPRNIAAADDSTEPAAGSPPTATAPNGDVATLVAFIDKLAKQRPQGATEEEQLADFINMQNARLDAAKKVLTLNPDQKTKELVLGAAMEILTIYNRFGVPGAAAQRLSLAKILVKDKDPEIARLGRILIFDSNISQIARQPISDGKEIIAQVEELLAAEKDEVNERILQLAAQASDLLRQQGLKEDAVKILKMIADAARKDPNLAEQAEQVETHAKIVEADITGTLLVNVLTGEPDSEAKLVEGVKALLAAVKPGALVFKEVQEVAYRMEVTGHNDASTQILDELEAAFKDVSDEKLAEAVKITLANARTRLGLIGQPFVVEGLLIDGQPFDWSAYAGKVVLVDFWATWCTPCIEEMPNIRKNYESFKEAGFEVVGVNLDGDIAAVKEFLSFNELPWTSVTSQEVLDGKADPEPGAFGKLPMAEKNGVDGIPFLVLVGKDGKVDSLHVRGTRLKTRLTQLLGEPAAKPVEVPSDPTKPAAETPAEKPAEQPAEDKPAAEKPAAEKPAAEKPAAERPAENSGAFAPRAAATPLALLAAQAILAADEPATVKKDQPLPAEDTSINPYKAKPGLTTAQLIDYIERMFDKPKSIRVREGFTEAIVDACDRILGADPPAKEVELFVAVESKCEALHRKACTGNEACDKQLLEFVEKLKDDERPRIARQVDFFQRERKVLDAAEMPLDQVPALLKELQEYYDKEKLTARHLRMASSTVGLINRLEDGDQREEHFVTFGSAFAKASDKELARYGKKLAKKPGTVESDLVGKPLELAGTTAKGVDFVWDAYRGKVVIVDFWATWCGPCRREIPNVKAFYEKNVDRGFDVVGVSLDEDTEALAQYLEENQIPWDNLAGEGTQELASKYGIRGIPTMMLVDRDGKVVSVAHSLDALAPQAEKLLAAPAAAPAK